MKKVSTNTKKKSAIIQKTLRKYDIPTDIQKKNIHKTLRLYQTSTDLQQQQQKY